MSLVIITRKVSPFKSPNYNRFIFIFALWQEKKRKTTTTFFVFKFGDKFGSKQIVNRKQCVSSLSHPSHSLTIHASAHGGACIRGTRRDRKACPYVHGVANFNCESANSAWTSRRYNQGINHAIVECGLCCTRTFASKVNVEC